MPFRIILIFYFALLPSLGFAKSLSSFQQAQGPSVAYLNQWDAAQYGKEFKDHYEQAGLVLNDPIATDFIEKLGKRLIKNSSQPQIHVHYFIVKSSDLNSFTGAGAYIGITSGIIGFVKNENQLAAIMAHETGHVVQGHLARMLAIKNEIGRPVWGAAIASAAIAVFNPAAGLISLTSSVAGYQQFVLNYTRADEKEADHVGMGILYKAGFSPMAMPNLFIALQHTTELYDTEEKIFRNHPSDDFRIADSLNRAKLYPQKAYPIHREFYLIQARIKAETSQDLHLQEHLFLQQAQSKKSYEKIAGLYGYALITIQLENYTAAKKVINKLINLKPHELLFQLAKAHLQVSQRHYQQAFLTLKKLHQQHYKNYPISFAFAVTAYQAQHYQAVESILEFLEVMHPDNLAIYEYLSKSQATLHEKQAALITMAKLDLKIGNSEDAHALLLRALHTPTKNPYGKEQVEALLNH